MLVDVLKPGGHFVLGLYNRYGRIPTKLRGYAIRALGMGLMGKLDPVVRNDRKSARRQRAWLRDQYFHPLEETHTVDEVLGWFSKARIEYVNAVPKGVCPGASDARSRLPRSESAMVARLEFMEPLLFLSASIRAWLGTSRAGRRPG